MPAVCRPKEQNCCDAFLVLILVATLIPVVLSEGPFGQQGRFLGGFRGPLVGAAATPGISSVEPVYPPQPYSFGYDNVDEFGTQSYHKEQGDANNVKTGTYGYRDASGIYRRVSYVADANGFRATVDTNEPGTAPGYSADAVFNAKPAVVPAAAKSASAPIPAYAAPVAFGPAPWSG
ncbi:cuticle protein 10.9 [Dermacentor silvarum]|uniref:cuticle protein 10.9 n=1 Tax=Dermacentor silvarum TaxID=543639 RepID=UPI00210141BC|nr:cuticle protein 10.9 [Dermacentor silvarum]